MKVFYFVVIIYANLTNFTIFSLKNEKISSCRYESGKLTFTCGDNESSLFKSKGVQCSKNVLAQYNSVDTIDFQNCLSGVIVENFFDKFKSLKTVMISDMDITTLQMRLFRETVKLEKLNASRNRLTQIPNTLFSTTKNFRYADFSNNSIDKIDNLRFEGENIFLTLNISYNKITELDLRNLSAPSLDVLDASNNNISILTENTFDQFIKLEKLTLSYNPIGNLKIETFAYLAKLEYLKLRRTNISSLQMGTFSHQRVLFLLDLSENALKELDCNIFLPSFKELNSLYLGENELTELTDFRNSLFPQLRLLDIKNNRFNCSYLKSFMKSVNWDDIRIPVDLKSIDPREANIHGIKCIITEQNGFTDSYVDEVTTQNDLHEVTTKNDLEKDVVDQSSSSNTYFIVIIVLLLFLILLLVFMFLFVNRDKIRYIGKSVQSVEYSNDMCLLH